MIVKVPEISFEVPTGATLWSIARKGAVAVVVVAGLVGLAHWQRNAGFDRKALERLTAANAADPVQTGALGRKAAKR